MLENDYIIKQINMAINFLASVLFKKDTTEYHNIKDEKGNVTYIGRTVLNLRQLADEGKINEAEDLLFNEIEKNPKIDLLEAAIDFYGYLNEKDDSFLEKNNFSRQEIFEGLQDVQKIYGIEQIYK